MEVGQCLGVTEPAHLGHEAFDQMEHAVRPIDEAGQLLMRIDGAARTAFIEPVLRARGLFGRRHPEEGQIIAALELARSEEHTSELQSLMRISYAVFCLKKKNKRYKTT